MQGIQPVEPAELNFMFKARAMPDQGAGQLATRPKKDRDRRQTSLFKPFQLSTDVSALMQPIAITLVTANMSIKRDLANSAGMIVHTCMSCHAR